MSSKYTDELSRILEDSTENFRRDIWLWFWLNSRGANFGSYHESKIGMRDMMANHLIQNPGILNQLIDDTNNRILADREMEWLSEGKRQIEWIRTKLVQYVGYSWSSTPQNVFGKDLLILLIDLWHVDTSQKKITLQNLQHQWNAHRSNDGIYRWFEDDTKKSLLAWEWLSTNTSYTTIYSKPFETYDDLMIFIDSENLTPDQKTLYIERIKKRWSQKKYREGLKGKAQYNFVLSDKAATNLNNLANLHGISRARVLEILLEMETTKNDYIPDKIRLVTLLSKP